MTAAMQDFKYQSVGVCISHLALHNYFVHSESTLISPLAVLKDVMLFQWAKLKKKKKKLSKIKINELSDSNCAHHTH